MKKILVTLVIFIFSALLNAQTNVVWFTANNVNQLDVLKRKFNLQNLKQALPDSKKPELLQVYEAEINSELSIFLDFINKSDDFSKPVIIEDFTLLYEPNDYNAFFATDYALDLINAKQAWDITKGSPVIKLGILDSNFDTLQEEINGTYSFISPNIYGTNYNHGTAVAGTAAGNTDNGTGKSAIGFNCDMILYGMNYNHVLEASYAGARVLNLSWASGCSYNFYYQSVIDEVVENGTVVVAAAGNGPTCGGAGNYVYPASFKNVISVSSIGPNDNHERTIGNPNTTHQHNDSVDIVAPGYDVAIPLSNNAYTTGNGTSFAAPYVTGTIGLMLSVNPCLTIGQVEMILKATAVSVDSLNPQYTGLLGAGRLDAYAAVEMAEAMIPIDYTMTLKEETCTYGVGGISINLNSGDTALYNLQWNDGSNSWNRNNLTSGNYSFTISSPNGCSIHESVQLSVQGPFMDYPNSIFVQDNNTVLEDKNNDGVINVRGSIVIGEGVNYSINNKNIQFSDNSDLPVGFPYSGIVVKGGAILTVDNSRFDALNGCTNIWGGIELWGDNVNNSVLDMKNSTVANATVAVSNIPKSVYNSSIEMNGGRIILNNNVLENNKMGVNLIETMGNKKFHSVLNNVFLNTANISNQVHLNLEAVDQIEVSSNTFNGNVSLTPSKRGTGIKAINSSINTTGAKPSFQIDSTDNVFADLFEGIVNVNNSKKQIITKIANGSFINVVRGLTFNGDFKGTVENNQFIVPTGNTEMRTYGIAMNGQNANNIYYNYFYSETMNNNFGIISNKSVEGKGSIKLNTIEGKFEAGIRYEGQNNFSEISCNTFNIQGVNDWNVVSDETGAEGTLEIASQVKFNTFSDPNDVSLNINQESSNAVLWYEDATAYIPAEVSPNVSLGTIEVTLSWEEQCLNNLNSGTFTIEETASISEDSFTKEEFRIYPNPSNGVFQVEFSKNSNIDEIHFMTIDGKLLKNFDANLGGNINMSQLSAGTYMVAFYSNNSVVQTDRVIIQ